MIVGIVHTLYQLERFGRVGCTRSFSEDVVVGSIALKGLTREVGPVEIATEGGWGGVLVNDELVDLWISLEGISKLLVEFPLRSGN